MTFRVGQKVIHVPADKQGRKLGKLDWPKEVASGRVLTIRDIDTRYVRWYGVVGLRFEELHYPRQMVFLTGMVEPAFPADQFRPVVERKTDISVFTKILDDVNGKVTA